MYQYASFRGKEVANMSFWGDSQKLLYPYIFLQIFFSDSLQGLHHKIKRNIYIFLHC